MESTGMGDEEEWNTRCLIRSAKSLHEGAKTRVRVKYVLQEDNKVKMRIYENFVLSPFFEVVRHAVTDWQ